MLNRRRPVSCLIAGIALAVAGAAAWAQQAAEIVVEAPRIQAPTERTSTGFPIEVISVTHRVSYRDLDLSTAAGAKALEQRVKDSATAACKEIGKLYPLVTPVPNSPPCEKTAIDEAMAQVHVAVAAAQKGTKK